MTSALPMKRGVALLTLVVGLIVPASALGFPLEVAPLTQLTGTYGCNQSAGGGDGCATATGIAGAADSVAVSPDGKNAYAVSETSNSVVEFARDPHHGSALIQLGPPNDCIAQGGSECGTTSGRGLIGATGVTVSPDGRNVYVASTGSPGETGGPSSGFCSAPDCAGAVAVFSRDPATGVLTQLSGTAGCFSEQPSLNGHFETTCASGTGLAHANSVVVSPQSDSVYATSGNSNAIAEFKRDPATGALTQLDPPNNCIAETGGPTECGTHTAHGLVEPNSVEISSDGTSAYVASQGIGGNNAHDGTVAAFHREAGTGALTQLGGESACVGEAGADNCPAGRGIDRASSVTVSGDGKNVYVAGGESNGVGVFSRDLASGALTQLPGTAGCLQARDGNTAGASDGCTTATGLHGASAVVVTPDDINVYVGSAADAAVGAFSRDPGTGGLTQLAPPYDCTAQGGSECGTTTGRALTDVHGLAVSPDADTVYAASLLDTTKGSVAAFDRADPPPTCSATSAVMAADVTSSVFLPCSDPGGATISRFILNGAGHGRLGPVDQSSGTVPYTPDSGFSGFDNFIFGATDQSEVSVYGSADLTVLPPGPHCSIAAAQAKKAAAGAVAALRPRLLAPKVIVATIRCDQDATVTLTTTVTATLKKGRRASVARRRRTRRFALPPVAGTAHANLMLALTERLPKQLQRLLERRAKESARLMLTATNAKGTNTVTGTIPRLRLQRRAG